MKKHTLCTSLFALILIGTTALALMGCQSDDKENVSTQGASSPSAAALISGSPQEVPIPGMVTMVDIGAHACVPCKMMTPIIAELSNEYDGRAAIVFIDVWEHREEAAKFGVRSIPTQIFYDANGNEMYRHIGFLDKASIVTKLTELGVQ